ncbi:BspA family leucine-rich repeat surface protein [Glutamicibacter arilaitensis]|uniref:BspA family leucine-rich repeat surface protein n=1 Tax=Glutamicibacter arilaitensis TaxID=256701 RepID=UPI003FD02D40
MSTTLKQRVLTALGNERGETITSAAIGSLASTVVTLAVSASMIGMIAVQQNVEDRTEKSTGYASVEHSIRDSLTWASDIPSAEARADRLTTISTGIGTEDQCQASTWTKAGQNLTLTQQTYPGYTFHPTTGMPICRGTAVSNTDSVISGNVPEEAKFVYLSATGKTLERDGKVYVDDDGEPTRIAGVHFSGADLSIHQIASRLTPENAHSIETAFVDGDDRNSDASAGESVSLENTGVMKSVWDLGKAPRGTCDSGERMITLPLHSRGEQELKADIHWGDGKRTDEETLKHCYEKTSGLVNVTIIGEVPSYGVVHEGGKFVGVTDRVREGQMRVNRALVEVKQFTEELKTTTLDAAFAGAEDLRRIENLPDTVESMNLTFMEGSNVEFGSVDTSNVFSLRGAFKGNTQFDRSINNWDTGKVTDLYQVFAGATKYDQPLNFWDVREVENVQQAFKGATSFNRSLRSWDVKNIERFDSMLEGAEKYEVGLANWNPRSAESWSDFATGTLLDQEDLPKEFRDPVEPEESPSPSPSPSEQPNPSSAP